MFLIRPFCYYSFCNSYLFIVHYCAFSIKKLQLYIIVCYHMFEPTCTWWSIIYQSRKKLNVYFVHNQNITLWVLNIVLEIYSWQPFYMTDSGMLFSITYLICWREPHLGQDDHSGHALQTQCHVFFLFLARSVRGFMIV